MALPPVDPSSTALVTGASSGIGEAIARMLAERGYGVTLVARREERLTQLADELADKHDVRALAIACDLVDPAARNELAAQLDEVELSVDILVNNAGFGSFGDLHREDREEMVRMARLNMEALLDLQARYLPGMVERGHGAVINLASGAAFQPMPSNATYAATKAFVLHLGEGVHHELKGTGVAMTTVCPGPVKTEFVEVAGMHKAEGRTPEFVWATAEQVAADALQGAERNARVVVPGTLNRVTSVLGRHSPHAMSLPLISRVWRAAN